MSEISVRRAYRKRFLLLLAFCVGGMTLLSYEFVHGNLSPRGLGISALVLFAGYMIAPVLLARKSRKEALAAAPPPGTPIDEATRKQRLRTIRAARIAIAFLVVGLVFSLFQGFPFWGLMVGVIFNLTLIVAFAVMVVRLKKSLE